MKLRGTSPKFLKFRNKVGTTPIALKFLVKYFAQKLFFFKNQKLTKKHSCVYKQCGNQPSKNNQYFNPQQPSWLCSQERI